jgi:hypothetical protein
MKPLKVISFLILTMVLLFGFTSCVVFTRHDNGQHNGWHKGPDKPGHHKSNGNGNGNGNSKGSSATIIIRTT